MTTTTGRFDLTSWEEEVFDDAEGARLVRASIAKAFEGGITGTSTAALLQAFASEGPKVYVGIERVTADVDGRKGTFVLRHSALDAEGGGDIRVDVLPGSGTGDLTGLRGEMVLALAGGEHTYTFAYELH